MTVIAAVRTDAGVWMGADSGIDEEFGRKGSGLVVASTLAIDKVHEVSIGPNETLLWGLAGSWSIAQRIEFDHAWSHPHHSMELREWLYIEAKNIRALFFDDSISERSQMLHEDDDYPGLLDATILVGFRGRIFSFDGSGCADECSLDFQAVGSGMLPAAGALFCSNNLVLPAQERLHEALSASAYFHPEIQPPFTIKFAPKEKPNG